MLLLEKKPDYLGVSMWEFRNYEHPIDAKILDLEWLRRFQNREVDVRPGDSLRAFVKTEVKYGFQSEVVAVHHSVLEVREVIPQERDAQIDLHPRDEDGPDIELT